MEIELLKLIKNSMEKQGVKALGYPNIDRLCLKQYPELVFENKLSSMIKKLLNDGLVQKSDKNGVMFTEKGLEYLKQHSEE
ncbi:hypothetical protein [Elizabethkingia meningoseptica]|uniref:hypothetical protein n=1 Tax=Elizabethkingia meningoseptica TaxID=238 RepID=UPI0023B1DC32|nr:hypothetical protein [Elizabethkingia meningoseptica]MDE5492144.1 hypothetical protein [Elizabethkingia meningoseptica]MEC4710204.1 hypothetical protein [Elizabethkingia meningoseptica]